MKTTNASFEETITLDSVMLGDKQTKVRETSDGYMICMPRIARTGIQLYQGAELGIPEMGEVRVYRPESEVFSKDAVRSLAGKPVTIEHPKDPVNATNWRDLAVGHIGEDVMRDGDFIRVPLILMDAAAVEEVKSGRSQLSVGYSAVLQWQDGVTPSGEKYHVKQTAIRANHVAITHTARGGPLLRMGDNRRKTMATRTITVDSFPVELEDKDAQIVERHIAKLAADLANAQSVLAAAQTTAQTDAAKAATEISNIKATVSTKDAEIATLKQQATDAQVTPKKLQEMARNRAHVEQRAKALMDSCICDDKTDEEIRRQVVNAKMGDTAKDWTDDMVKASFNTLAVSTDSDGSGLHHVVNVIAHNEPVGGDARSKAYAEYETGLTNRWKTAGVRNQA